MRECRKSFAFIRTPSNLLLHPVDLKSDTINDIYSTGRSKIKMHNARAFLAVRIFTERNIVSRKFCFVIALLIDPQGVLSDPK